MKLQRCPSPHAAPARGPRTQLIALAVIAVACSLGCSDNDESVTTIDEETALRQSLGVVEVVDAMLARVDEIATGEIGALSAIEIPNLESAESRSADGPVWDPVEEQWVNVIEYEGEGSALTYLFTIQFTNEDGSHPSAPSKLTAGAVYELLADMRSTSYGLGDVIAHDMQYACGLEIADLAEAMHTVTGTGEMSGTLTGTKNGRPLDADIAMTWDVQVDVPRAGGCGSGTMAIAVGPYVLSAWYSPNTSAYSWKFSRDGGTVSEGTGAASCGKSKSASPLPAPDR